MTVLRAAMIIGSGSASFEIMRYLVQRLPVMITPTWVSTRCQPIAIENVLGYLVGVLSSADTTGVVFDIGGREILSYRDIMRIMAEELGLPRRWILPVPLLTPRLSSHWIQLVTPLSHRIARPLAEDLKNEVVCHDDRITLLIPQARLDVREAIHAALSQVKAHLAETHWSMAGPMPGDPDWSGGTVFRDVRQIAIALPSRTVFRAVCRVGGEHGWSPSWLWRLRGWLDQRAGGPGLRRGRRHPDLLRYGDALDFWRVVGIERDRSLSLRAEMKLPGQALLDFRVVPDGESKCNSPAVASVGLSTQIGVEAGTELSVEEREKAAYNPTRGTMHRGGNASEPDPGDVSSLLRAWSDGDQRALALLMPIVHDELRRLAHHYMRRERAGHSLQTTALVNEAYLRLVDYRRMHWQNRAHFLAVSAQAMRRILVDHARRHNAKRGGRAEHVSLDAEAVMCTDRSDDFASLDDALNALAERAPRKAKVVELRFFGGLSVEETAEVLRVSSITIMREWKSAKAWLYRELTGGTMNGSRTLESRR